MKVAWRTWYAGAMLTALAVMAASGTAAAQQRGRRPHARTHAAPADSSRGERQRSANPKTFRGIAAKLNTTPEALAAAYERARQTNPRLNRGQFIAANVLAANLGPEHPNITTQAILSGLQSGNSIGQTLQSLGLSASESTAARQTASREGHEAEGRDRDEQDSDNGNPRHDGHGKRPERPERPDRPDRPHRP